MSESFRAAFQKCAASIASATSLAQRSREMYLERHGSSDQVFASLELDLIDGPGDPNLHRFYDLYETIFTLPSEKESFEGFEQVFAFNGDRRWTSKFGHVHEAAICASYGDELVAAVNFTAYAMPPDLARATHIDGTGHIAYLFVRPDFRMLGIGSRLVRSMKRYCQNVLQGRAGTDAMTSAPAGGTTVLHFCEQNAPEQMTLAEYVTDGTHAMIDQCDRLMWWDDQGYRRLDFAYLQPPLSAGAGACDALTLNVEAAPHMRAIASSIVRAHLDRFLAISVAKGAEIGTDPSYAAMMSELRGRDTVSLIGSKADHLALKSRIVGLTKRELTDEQVERWRLARLLG